MDELLKVLENKENYTITQALKETKSTFDLLCIINYILYDIIDETRYNIENKQQQKDFEDLQKIKDKILSIKNRNIK